MIEKIFLTYLGVLSLMIGSFLNVVALRIPNGESIVSPPSHCTSCGHRLGILDLVPVLSYVALRGRCRYCGDRVSPVYAIFEGLTFICAFILYFHFGLTAEFGIGFFLTCVLITVTITDLKYMRIPDKIVLPCMVVMFVIRVFFHPLPFYQYFLGYILGGLLLLLIALVSRGGMGGGDIKLYAFIGLAVGYKLVLIGFFLSCLIGAMIGLILIRVGIYKRKEPIPFAPYILLGNFVAYVWGMAIWHSYLELFSH